MALFEVVYCDSEYIVVNKAPQIPCHPLSNAVGDTLIEQVAQAYPEVCEQFGGDREGGLCHRIDNGTSGLVVIARNIEARQQARALFAKGKIKKTYLALVLGRVDEDFEINDSIAHHPKNKKKMVVMVTPNIRHRAKPQEAQTKGKVLLSNSEASLVRVNIGAGRRHQIRVHLASMQHPWFGDELYNGPKAKFLLGHALHAESIILPNEQKIEAPCPQEWEKELVSLKLISAG